MYVCMYVCMCVYTYIYTHTYIHRYVYIYIYIHIYTHSNLIQHTKSFSFFLDHAWLRLAHSGSSVPTLAVLRSPAGNSTTADTTEIYIYIYREREIHAYTHIYIYIYICIYIHTYTHILIFSLGERRTACTYLRPAP